MLKKIRNNPNDKLTREELALALTLIGFKISPKTLATIATRGGGPPYRRWNARVLYRWADALAWAEGKLGPVQCNTSEYQKK